MFIIFIIIILMSSFFVIFGYYNQLSLHEEKEHDRLTAIVGTIGHVLDGDAHATLFERNPNKGDITTVDEDSIYNSLYCVLKTAAEVNKLNSTMYTMVYNAEKNVFEFGVRSDDKVYFRDEYKQFPQILLDSMSVGGTVPTYQDEHGVWMSAFYPIKKSNGEVVGILQADIEFGYFISMVREKYTRQALIALGVIIAIALILFPYVRKVLRKDQEQKEMLEAQKHEIEEKNKDITDSINYALKIQTSILPARETFEKAFRDSFVYYKSKDIVAGDFYWMEVIGDDIFLACADCTGHGVPGAMVSVVCSNALNRTVNEMKLTNTGEILNAARDIVVNQFRKGDSQMNDGMDVSFARINFKTNTFQFSGANNPIYHVSEKQLTIVKGDKQPVGKFIDPKPFTAVDLTIKAGDCIYLFTDGFADQFGGKDGKKFKYKPFQEILLANHDKPMKEQMDKVNAAFVDWLGNFEQVDDICVIGIRI